MDLDVEEKNWKDCKNDSFTCSWRYIFKLSIHSYVCHILPDKVFQQLLEKPLNFVQIFTQWWDDLEFSSYVLLNFWPLSK